MKRDKTLDIIKACASCEYASLLHLTDQVLCSRRGIVDADFSCRRFSYDPLKRNPKPFPQPELEFVDVNENNEKKADISSCNEESMSEESNNNAENAPLGVGGNT